jgi:hypothetical protein
LKYVLLLVFIFSARRSVGQAFRFPQLDTFHSKPAFAAPPGWFVKSKATGDLDGDGKADIALVFEFQKATEETRPDSSKNSGAPRILAVYLYQPAAGAYRLLLQNNTFIPRYGEGGMDPEPFDGVDIRGKRLFVNIEFLRGYIRYRFRFQQGDLFLIGADSGGASGGMLSSFSANFLTGLAKAEKGPIDADKLSVTWLRIPRQLRRLRNMKMIQEWEVVKGHYF